MSNPFQGLWDRIKANTVLHVGWCAAGVIGCLVIYGVLQERIMQHPYGIGDQAETFKFTLFLVLVNRLFNMGTAITALTMNGQYEEFKPVAPLYSYAAVSLSNVVATFCQYESLKYLSFPVQTLGKCAKMLPVMIWGILIMRKKYTLKDFMLAFLITGGCTIFIMTGETKAHKAAANSSMYGALLMLGYLGFDGFTSTFQDKMFKGYNMTTYNQIFYVNMFSALISVLGLISNNQLFPALGFVARHPDALSMFLTFSLAATIGQLFISYTIKTFGALVFATIMTTRQFISILLSCLIFFHPLTLGQWGGTFMVFGTLYYQSFTKSSKGHGHGHGGSSPKAPKPEEELPLTTPKEDPAARPIGK